MASFRRGDGYYHDYGYGEDEYDDSYGRGGVRLSETYGDFAHQPPAPGNWKQSYPEGYGDESRMVTEPVLDHHGDGMTDPSYGAFSGTSGVREDDDIQVDEEDEELFAPPIGFWKPSSDYATNAYAIRSMLARKHDTFAMSVGIHYKLGEGKAASWSIEKEWGGSEGEAAPYLYSGSKFGADRIIDRMWLLEARNASNVSQSLSFSLKSNDGFEMLHPIIPVLVSTKSDGPVFTTLAPGERLETPIFLWLRTKQKRISKVVENNPSVTPDDLLRGVPLDNVEGEDGIRNLIPGKSLLYDYVKEKIESGEIKTEDIMEPVQRAGYFRITDEEVRGFIQKWMEEQSRDLYVKHLNDLVITPERATRASVDSKEREDNPFDDRVELTKNIQTWSLGDDEEEKKHAEKEAEHRTQSIYLKIQVELLPRSKEPKRK